MDYKLPDDFDNAFNEQAKNFNKAFETTQRAVHRTWLAVIIMWCLGALVSLTVLAGLIWVAAHFIQKVW